MTKDNRTISDRALDIAGEIERFASFDLQTRRFIAYAISLVSDLHPLISDNEGVAGNPPQPFEACDKELAERQVAYAQIAALRACSSRGAAGRRERRLNFGLLLEPARVDLKWKRLTTLPAFFFCYERIMGPQWRELLPLAWEESVLQRRKRSAPRQLPLDARLREDSAVPSLLEADPAPWFFPSMADADAAGDAPLLSML